MMLVGINNIHTNKLRFPQIVDLLKQSARQTERLLRFRDARYFRLRQRDRDARARRRGQMSPSHPL